MFKAKYRLTIIAVILAVVTLLGIIAGGVGKAFAAEGTQASYIMDDLRTDKKFKVDDYPLDQEDNKLQVIQIAETTDKELLIYVYQPTAQYRDFRASSINISRSDGVFVTEKISFPNYKLKYLSSYSVFYKYRVEGFVVNDMPVRYYNISNILRPFDEKIDKKPAGNNVASDVPNKVGQLWTVKTENDTVTYEMKDVETIEILNKFVGRVIYPEDTNIGWTITKNATSSHFVAFDTDRPIDRLLEVDLEFKSVEVERYPRTGVENYGQEVQHGPVTLSCEDWAENKNGKYKWKRIQSTSEFLKTAESNDVKITKEGFGNLENTKWVLSFYETDIYEYLEDIWLPVIVGPLGLLVLLSEHNLQTEVSDVMLLRMKFEHDGKTYNLGVVDNHQSAPPEEPPINEAPKTSLWDKIKVWVFLAIGIVVAIILIVIIVKLSGAINAARTARAVTKMSRNKRK